MSDVTSEMIAVILFMCFLLALLLLWLRQTLSAEHKQRESRAHPRQDSTVTDDTVRVSSGAEGIRHRHPTTALPTSDKLSDGSQRAEELSRGDVTQPPAPQPGRMEGGGQRHVIPGMPASSSDHAATTTSRR